MIPVSEKECVRAALPPNQGSRGAVGAWRGVWRGGVEGPVATPPPPPAFPVTGAGGRAVEVTRISNMLLNAGKLNDTFKTMTISKQNV